MMIEQQMNAVRLHAPGDPATLVYERIETPQPGPGEVLVRVHAAAITRDELAWPEDRLPATPSYEFSGVVAAIGSGVEGTAVGEAVYALSGFDREGAAAEYIVVPAGLLAPKPRQLGHVETAAIPLAGLSAWQGLFDHGQLKQGQRVLIHAAGGAYVIGTASTGNVQTALELGANQVIDHTTARFEDAVDAVDLVFDTAGGERLERSPAVLRAGGRLVSVAGKPRQHASERGISAVYFVVEPNGDQLADLAELADNGQLRPTIDQVFPLADARKAFARSLRHNRRGKIVLRVADET